MIRKLGRIPVILCVIGAFLNSGDLLAEFQPEGRAWVGYIAAASVGVALYLCVEGLLMRPHWSLIVGVIFFGLAEVSGQILHAALIRSDVVVMTDFMRWLMGYISPSLVVIAGIVMAFVVQYGFPKDGETAIDQPLTRRDLELTIQHLASGAALGSAGGGEADASRPRRAVRSAAIPSQLSLELESTVVHQNGSKASVS